VGALSPQAHAFLGGLVGRSYGADPEGKDSAPAGSVAHTDAPAPAPSASGLQLPPPPVAAALVLAFLAFGALLGHVARSPPTDALASARAPLRVVLPASGADSTQPPSPGSSASSSEEETPPPESESQATPTPAPAAGAGTATNKASRSPGAGGSGSSSPAAERGASKSKAEAEAPAKKLPPLKHVFVIMLSDEPYASVFGPSSTAPYLTGTLLHKGELLAHFDAVAHEELADEAALISGQGATAETSANCPAYTEIVSTGLGTDEQVLGTGCVYPPTTKTLASQLISKHLTWRAYVQGTGEAGPQAGACEHPSLGASDPTAAQTASAGPYATFRNPFVYFDSVLNTPQCTADDVGLGRLRVDLAQAKSTPSFSYVAPDRCHDGNPTPCTPGAPAGMPQANAFLGQVVPEILESKAYKENGLLVVTVDEAPSSGPFADSSSCCGQPLFPDAPSKTLSGSPKGGGLVGALLLSPYVKAGTSSQEPFNDFSLLRTIEDVFGLGHLGYAALPAVKSFEPEMFTAGKG
jgi:phosphatidylinositol-3-phosphatase